ncbi:MAG TPA: HEAT repeat domain-containing protein, partial [Gemmatimonadales bacterium]|nr:HEAT repeat domain-containing protein [Gemmatimonadales bacterium]
GIQALRAARDAPAREAAAATLVPVAAELVARRHAGLVAEAIVALDAARQTEPGQAGPTLARAAAAFADGGVGALLIERLADPHVPSAERDLVARAVGLLADVAAGLMVDAYLAAPPEGREPFRAAIRSGGERAIAPLEPYLADPRPEVAAVAAEFVGLVGGARTGDLLTPRVRHSDPRVREAALLGLARAGGRPLVRTAVPALRDASAAVRAAAAHAVAAAGDLSAVDVLVRRADEEGDEGTLAEVLRAIGTLGGPGALEALKRFAQPGTMLRRRSPFVRSAAVTALAQVPGSEARALVEHYTHDREPAVRRAAQAAMTT